MISPFQDFLKKDIQAVLVNRTYHRPENGGFDSWEFKLDNGNDYYFLGDIRHLEEFNEKVLFVTLYKKVPVGDNRFEYSARWETEDRVNFASLVEVITNLAFRIQFIRRYRYIVITICPGWEKLITFFMKKICESAPEDVKEVIFKLFRYEVQIEMDAGYTDFFVGDIYTNPGVIEINPLLSS
jgi:hypothetical protein